MINDINKIPAQSPAERVCAGEEEGGSGNAVFATNGGNEMKRASSDERTPEVIGAEIRMYVDAGRRVTLLCGIEIGRRLVEAKELLNHGEWLPWLKRETDFSERSAQNYMKVFNSYSAAQLGLFGPETNAQTFADLPISKALALLSVPESEREDFAAEVGAEAISVRELEARVRERTAEIEAEKERLEKAHAVELHDAETALDEATEARDAAEIARREAENAREAAEIARRDAENDREAAENARREAEETILRMKREIEEIEARPRDVAVERDEEAIAQAVQAERERLEGEKAGAVAKAANDAADAERAKHREADKKAKEKIKALEEELRRAGEQKAAAEKTLEELKAKAEAADRAGADSEALKKQVEGLQKQLALAAPEVSAFKAAFDRAQGELVHAEMALKEIRDEEIREKVSRAFTAMLEGFLERVKG